MTESLNHLVIFVKHIFRAERMLLFVTRAELGMDDGGYTIIAVLWESWAVGKPTCADVSYRVQKHNMVSFVK
jgi:hypothetical protein